MAVYVLKDCKLYIAEFNLSGDHNTLQLEHGAEEKDVTRFGATAIQRLAGLETISLQHEGFTDYALNDVDQTMFARTGAAAAPVTVAPTTGLIGERAYLFQGVHLGYNSGGAVGDVHSFEASAVGADSTRLVSGTVLHDTATARTSTSTSTAQQVGAVGATQKLYAALHVVTVSGTSPTLAVTVQSDNAQGFPSPANQITFTTATAATSQWATPVSGAITDNWWRISYTIGGTNPSFTFIVSIGIK